LTRMIVGYTTGVFDLFHIGHLNILKSAKSQCDVLIVGVTSDETCVAYKNKRPVIAFDERLEIVKAITYVDDAVEQHSMDKFEAWNKLKFNKMFVGNDWQGSEKWNVLEEKFQEYGVEIVYFPYTENTSSSLLRSVLDKIK
jgi:glycerol-3-phosphate cytidylyltransferase